MRKKYLAKFFSVLVVVATSVAAIPTNLNVSASDCPDVKIIFARGSGGTRYENIDYQAFKSTLETKMQTTDLKYEFDDLDYPAVGVGIEHVDTTLGAFFGGGEAYDFGDSMSEGVKNLKAILTDTRCQNTKYVLGGYSQGAMVVRRAAKAMNADNLIYIATFGDPKIYLPEGKGIMPVACRGGELSRYRVYVPDCRAYKGILGPDIPYEPSMFANKLGTWCNKRDILCSSYIVVSDHENYVADNLYEDASRVIFDKITKAFGIENHVSSPHDTAILIDSTGSMRDLIDKYKSEALRLAKQTWESGGRVALYDYRDLNDPYEAVQHCNFETCTMEVFEDELAKIVTDGGGDDEESLLSSAFKVMTELNWKQGSTKSLVVLTDANFLSPDRDGMSFDTVVKLSKTIDPVNFYIITKNKYASSYAELAQATDGLVVTNLNKLNLLTDYIMDRYDSLPRVEESEELLNLPTTEIVSAEWTDEQSVKIDFTTTGQRNLVILNDVILGTTNETSVTLTNLNKNTENIVWLVPINNDVRGEGAEVILSQHELGAPNTGRL